MAYSKVLIYNMALTNLGVSATIQNTSQSDTKTSTFNRIYDVARDQVLKDFDWNFAKTYKALTPTGITPGNTKYQYEFGYPNDCLAAREINDSDDIGFEICSNISGDKVINLNMSQATLRYTRRVTNEAFYPPEFAMALSWWLAFLGAPVITSSTDKAKMALSMYNVLVQQAMVSNANEGYENNPSEACWIDARNS